MSGGKGFDQSFTRKTKKDKERKNQEINGKYSAKHIRIQEENNKRHLENLRQQNIDKVVRTNKGNKGDK
jgi:hypothetical protein